MERCPGLQIHRFGSCIVGCGQYHTKIGMRDTCLIKIDPRSLKLSYYNTDKVALSLYMLIIWRKRNLNAESASDEMILYAKLMTG